jgi:hypothetical protein
MTGVVVPGDAAKTSGASNPDHSANAGANASSSSSAASGALEPEVRTLVATPHALEVGIDGGTNGWLRVRAEMDGTGGVSASVMATTASAVEALHKELPALSAYLTHESVGVSSLVVNRAEAGAGTQDAAMSFSGGNGAEFGSGKGGASGNDTVLGPEAAGADSVEPTAVAAAMDATSAAAMGGSYGAGSGGWLNVVA